jgi:mono/diheme cytochrome c family protein
VSENLSDAISDDISHAATNNWQKAYSIFTTKCVPCHGPKREFGGFRIDSREGLFKANEMRSLVVAGKKWGKSPSTFSFTGLAGP